MAWLSLSLIRENKSVVQLAEIPVESSLREYPPTVSAFLSVEKSSILRIPTHF
jgi:hypothetical protein